MNAKQTIVGVVVGTIVMLVVGYVLFDLALAGFYDSNMGSAENLMRETPQWWPRIVGVAAYSLMITLYLGAKGGSNPSVATGATSGAIVGLLIWMTVDFVFLGIMNITTLQLAIVDSIAEAVRGGIVGAVIAVVAAKLP